MWWTIYFRKRLRKKVRITGKEAESELSCTDLYALQCSLRGIDVQTLMKRFPGSGFCPKKVGKVFLF